MVQPSFQVASMRYLRLRVRNQLLNAPQNSYPRKRWEVVFMVTALKTVVITGASSGIGRAAVARMAQAGWSVFATVRKEQDGGQLRSDFGASVNPVKLDVTERPSVGAAA